VVAGQATFVQQGNTLIVTAANGTIITYPNFNIGQGETVQFIQPGQWATVLNHVLGPDPSVIAGSLLANGQVYIVNPAGVYFTNGSVVNVGGLYAAAGSISYANFQNGNNHFTDLTGSVVNSGSITGSNINLFASMWLTTDRSPRRRAWW
jgi:filamentous hemagglutinin family protein